MALLILIAGFVIATSLITAPYTELVPGDALPVSSLITVPPGRGHPIHGKVLLTDVGVQSLHYLEYFWGRIFSNPDNTVVPTGEVTYNLPESEFDAQGTVDMAESQLTAKSVALRQLGYPVPDARRRRRPSTSSTRPRRPGARCRSATSSPPSTARPPPTPRRCRTRCGPTNPVTPITLRVGSIAQPTPGHDVSVRLGSITSDHKKVAFLGIGDPGVPLAGDGDAARVRLPVPGEHQQ